MTIYNADNRPTSNSEFPQNLRTMMGDMVKRTNNMIDSGMEVQVEGRTLTAIKDGAVIIRLG